ncbi:hypothetical protein VPH35_134415 [Triticum aestivum]|uniref:BTB/POZ and MATH domain-containing protein 2-like n=1 Tax=Triticum aestivum TaxID=4565 RepID=UPI001D0166A6|nr:BTB/POZ and MATH domain-containing protein 2-like [Triticum aestivum]
MGVTACGRGAGMTVQGSHVFEISGYSLHEKLLGVSKTVESAVFDVGGHDWQITFYPGGVTHALRDYAALCISLRRKKNNSAKVRASIEFSLVDVTGSSPPHTTTMELDCGSDSIGAFTAEKAFKKRSELEAPPYLRDDRIIIRCVITLYKESSFVQSPLEVPPSDIAEHLRKLWQGKDGADVVFEVEGEDFPAHKTILAMRSPVFKAELYGAMREKDMNRITIADMQPSVFEALLYFIYTDSLPTNMDALGREDYQETIRHLLVAADRYAMERLKMMCESIICDNIDVKTVITTLALADQHRCGRLSDACIQFIASLDTTEMNDVIASQGYAELKVTCPNLDVLELWEKTYRLRNSKSSVHIGSLVTQI